VLNSVLIFPFFSPDGDPVSPKQAYELFSYFESTVPHRETAIGLNLVWNTT
jgi:hypothetical protein